jgi:hypothetical protein
MMYGSTRNSTNACTKLLAATILCAAVATWGCSKTAKLADAEHEHDCCEMADCHDHDHAPSVDTIKANLAKLSPADRKSAEAQGFCVIRTDHALGADGVPYKMTIEGHTVFLCCDHCKDVVLKDPNRALAQLDILLQQHRAHLPTNVK